MVVFNWKTSNYDEIRTTPNMLCDLNLNFYKLLTNIWEINRNIVINGSKKGNIR